MDNNFWDKRLYNVRFSRNKKSFFASVVINNEEMKPGIYVQLDYDDRRFFCDQMLANCGQFVDDGIYGQ